MENYFFKTNNYCKFRTVMPQGSTVSQFRPEWNVDFFAWKVVDSIYRGPRNEREIIIKKKKNLVKFRTRMPQRLIVLEFWSKYKGGFLRWNFMTAYTKVQERNGKLFLKKIIKKKKTRFNFVRQCPRVRPFNNSHRNVISMFLQENL